MANLGRLFTEGFIISLVLGLEYYTIRPLIGDTLGLGLIGITIIILILDVLKNSSSKQYSDTSNIVHVTAQKRASTINILSSEQQIVEGNKVSTYGQLNPAIGSKRVTIIATASDATQINTEANTAFDGRYTVTINLTKIGVWSLKASFAGDDTYLPSSSNSVQVTVTRLPPKADIKIIIKDAQANPIPGVTITPRHSHQAR